MKDAIQWLAEAVTQVIARFFPQFSSKKNTGVVFATIVCAGLMTIVDTLLLAEEPSMFRVISVGLTSVVKIGIAGLYAGTLASLYPVRGSTLLHPVQPIETFTKALRFLGFSILGVLLVGLVGIGLFNLNEIEIVERFFLSCMSLGIVALIVQQFQWLDALIAIRRTEMTGKFRAAAVIMVVLLILSQLLSDIVGFDNDGVSATLMVVLSVFFALAIVRLPWLATFTKEQKWRALAVSFGVMIAAIILAVFIADEHEGEFKHFGNFLPGLQRLMMMTSILSGLFAARVMVSVTLALPTATIIDRKINEVRSLSYLSRTISQVYDVERLLSIVITMIQDVCGATAAWIEMRDDDTGTMRIAAQLKLQAQQLQMLYKDGVLRSVLDAQKHHTASSEGSRGVNAPQALYFEALDEEPMFASVYPYTADFAQSLIAVPLMLDAQRIGTIFAVHRDRFAFEFEDVALLSAFANNISIAIENARLFENSLEQERFKREMMLARQMQQKLLPKELPSFGGFDVAAYTSPALEVGGDYYDCVELKSGAACLLIGDVSGKGITAAFYMAELKGVVLAVAQESASPKELLERVNAALLESVEKGSYITMTALVLDEERQELVIARAGHTPIAVYIKQGHSYGSADSVQLLTPRGFGVALVKAELFNPTLEEIRIPFPTGSRCLLFTDGVNESLNASNAEFGYEPIRRVLESDGLSEQQRLGQSGRMLQPAEMLVGAIIRQVVEFSAGMPQHDDMTVIALVARQQPAHNTAPEASAMTLSVAEAEESAS
jgi:serine phosphatase RsbU (regulator of sigma subunit)